MFFRLKRNETDESLYIQEGMETFKNAIASAFLIHWEKKFRCNKRKFDTFDCIKLKKTKKKMHSKNTKTRFKTMENGKNVFHYITDKRVIPQ